MSMLQTMTYELDAPPQADDPHDVSGVKIVLAGNAHQRAQGITPRPKSAPLPFGAVSRSRRQRRPASPRRSILRTHAPGPSLN